MALTRPRALVLRALGVGDLLTAVPALRGLRRALPSHELVLAAPGVLAPLVALVDVVDRLLPTAELAPVPWTGAPPDLAVNLHGRGPQSHRLLQQPAPRRLVAFGCLEAGVTGPAWREDEHEVRRWGRLVQETFDVPVDPTDLRIDRPGTDRPETDPPGARAVVIHAGAKAGARRWPADRFAEVARWCHEHGHPVLLTGGPDEVGLARRVQRLASLPVDAVTAGHTSLGELAGIVAAARLVVSGDTGVAHLATALGTRSVLLFGPTPPARWGPPPDPRHRVIWHEAIWQASPPGDGLADELHPALAAVSTAEVLAAVAAQLADQPVEELTGEVSCSRNQSSVAGSPSVSGTAGRQPSAPEARVMSGQRT